MPTTPRDVTPQQPRSSDLRERKRTRMRLAIQTEALRLFEQRGYDQTTVEEIADAAAISPRTFFRYFRSKEDVVVWDEYDEYDPLAPDFLAARPSAEPLAATCRAVIRETLGGLYRHDPERLLTRVRLRASVPDVRARFFEEQTKGIARLSELVAARRGARTDELAVRVTGSALLSAVSVALDLWQRSAGKSDLLELFDRATDALVAIGRDLSKSSAVR